MNQACSLISLFLVRYFRLDVSFEHKTVESSDLVTHKNSCCSNIFICGGFSGIRILISFTYTTKIVPLAREIYTHTISYVLVTHKKLTMWVVHKSKCYILLLKYIYHSCNRVKEFANARTTTISRPKMGKYCSKLCVYEWLHN